MAEKEKKVERSFIGQIDEKAKDLLEMVNNINCLLISIKNYI